MSFLIGLAIAPVAGLGRWWRRHWFDLLATLLLVYFAYHAVHGQRGLLAWLEKSRQLEVTQHDIASLQREHQELSGRVERLAKDAIDPDMLEEELRKLGFVSPDQDLVLTPREFQDFVPAP